MKKYKHLFFDLDRTIWDFDYNTRITFKEIFIKYNLEELGISSFEDFVNTYQEHNKKLWELYRNGKIEKPLLRVKRFSLTLGDFGIEDMNLAKSISHDYVTMSPQKTKLFPNAIETLSYLKNKYHMHIITNGFEEVQTTKIKVSGLEQYFNSLITSEAAGFKKPHKEIFEYALTKNNAVAIESLMIGDDLEIDVKGAQQAGIDQVFFNIDEIQTSEKVTFEIKSLKELMNIL